MTQPYGYGMPGTGGLDPRQLSGLFPRNLPGAPKTPTQAPPIPRPEVPPGAPPPMRYTSPQQMMTLQANGPQLQQMQLNPMTPAQIAAKKQYLSTLPVRQNPYTDANIMQRKAAGNGAPGRFDLTPPQGGAPQPVPTAPQPPITPPQMNITPPQNQFMSRPVTGGAGGTQYGNFQGWYPPWYHGNEQQQNPWYGAAYGMSGPQYSGTSYLGGGTGMPMFVNGGVSNGGRYDIPMQPPAYQW